MELMSDEWQRRFIDQVVKGVDAAIADIRDDYIELKSEFRRHTRATDRRLEKLEAQNLPKASKAPLWKDPKAVFVILQTILIISSIVLIIIARLSGVDIGGLL